MANRLKQVQDAIAAVVAEQDSLSGQIGAEADGDKRAELEAEFEALEKRFAVLERDLDREKRLQERERNLARVPDVNRLTGEEQEALFGEDGQPPQPKGAASNGAANGVNGKGFQGLGEQMQAVARACLPGGVRDPRLQYRAGGTGMNEQSPSDGGFLVQKEFETELLRNTYETGILAKRVRRRPIGPNANGLKMNAVAETSRVTGSRYGGVQVYWTPEGGLKTPSQVKLRQMELVLQKLTGLCYVTDELLEDATALEAILMDAFSEEFGFMLDDAILYGTGAGMPLGILNSNAVVTVSKEAGQAAGTITLNNVLAMYSRLWSRSMANAAWLVNVATLPQLYTMTLGGTAAVPVWLPPGGASESPFSTLMGLPVIPIEHAAALGTVGDVILADLTQYLMIDKGALPGGIQRASSIHVRFIYDETCFRWVYRVAGMPVWNSTQTPYKGSATVSPFVVLETR